jgi:hypothetical protein
MLIYTSDPFYISVDSKYIVIPHAPYNDMRQTSKSVAGCYIACDENDIPKIRDRS